MTIWETDAAILGSDEEMELQADGWEPFGVCYRPIAPVEFAAYSKGCIEVVYKRSDLKKQRLVEQRERESRRVAS